MSWSVEREREKERYDNLSNIFLPPYMVGVTFGIEFKNLELNRKQEESLFYCFIFGHHHVLGSTSSGDMCTVQSALK